jgi:HAD superfamily hydrolase (TIGR01549 family)
VPRRIPIFDLDGTLVDSDEALVAPFVALGVPRDDVTFGHVLEDECARLGISLDRYLAAYDVDAVQPFPGVADVIARLDRWAVCSNKQADAARAELSRLGWQPEVALFADVFDGSKQLGPVLDALRLGAGDVVFVGDTSHDRACASDVGCPFGLAAWNPRARAAPGDHVLRTPADVLPFLAR